MNLKPWKTQNRTLKVKLLWCKPPSSLCWVRSKIWWNIRCVKRRNSAHYCRIRRKTYVIISLIGRFLIPFFIFYENFNIDRVYLLNKSTSSSSIHKIEVPIFLQKTKSVLDCSSSLTRSIRFIRVKLHIECSMLDTPDTLARKADKRMYPKDYVKSIWHVSLRSTLGDPKLNRFTFSFGAKTS